MSAPMAATHSAEYASMRIEGVFNRCFRERYRTRLQGGADEPCYQPAGAAGEDHVLYYRANYFASALHECAHWCIAGRRRRQLRDFGYWYRPDGRDPSQQAAFESVECAPQALEWFFARACGYRFRISVDNLDPHGGALPDTSSFARRIHAQALHWQRNGLPGRAQTLFRELGREFGRRLSPAELEFSLADLE